MLETILTALQTNITIETVIYAIIGVVVGIIVGAIPGLTATMTIAILIPFTYHMDMITSLAMLLGVYNGGVYGGSISAILMSVPGTPAAVMTSLDGHPMALRGEGGKAIGIATCVSFLGGIFGCICLIFCCSALALVATKFSYPEYFVLTVFALIIIANSSGGSFAKGMIAAAFGVLVALVGTDVLTGFPRFTFGVTGLLSGISLIPCLIGLFGVSELLSQIFDLGTVTKEKQKMGKVFPGFKLLWKLKGVILRSAVQGTIIGALPGTGGTVAAFTAYNYEKARADDPDSFGKGNPAGVAACETANNAAIGGALIPMLALAVPGDGITAILMGAFLLHGINVGPSIFSTAPDVVYTVYIFEILTNVGMLVFGLLAAKWFAKIIDIDDRILIPIILLICMIGAYSASNNAIQIFVMLVFGIIGYIFKKVGIPATASILGIVLGQLSEVNFRSAMAMSKGSIDVFFRPIPLILWALALIMLVSPPLKAYLRKKKAAKQQKVG